MISSMSPSKRNLHYQNELPESALFHIYELAYVTCYIVIRGFTFATMNKCMYPVLVQALYIQHIYNTITEKVSG